MKWIRVFGVDDTFYRDIELIAGLFFSEAKVVTDAESQPDVDLFIRLEDRGDLVTAAVEMVDPDDGQRWTAVHTKQLSPTVTTGRERRKKVKQTISHAWLRVLQKATGVVQPWGILTGVRPTKLVHTLLLAGHGKEEVRRLLQSEYLIQPEKIALLEEIVDRQQTVLPDLYELDREVSLYIGIPFCPTKCAYCTFPAYAIQGRNGSVTAFLEGLHEEIAAVGDWLNDRGLPITTVYFGGGTPTSISAEQMDALFSQMKRSFHAFDGVREWTVEAGRPDTIDEEKLHVLKKWGVDRISINPQSFRNETLKTIGRHHTVEETLTKFALAREMGMNNINMDLIIGLPGEGLETFRENLRMIEQLKPESLTVHTLSFKRGSTMTQNKRKYRVANRDEVADMVNLAREWTKKAGYVPYYLYRQKNILGNQENVGYALPGHESLYNIIIMEERHTIIGLGCGAVSKIIPPRTSKVNRWSNPKEPQAYIDTYRTMIPEKLRALSEAYGERATVQG